MTELELPVDELLQPDLQALQQEVLSFYEFLARARAALKQRPDTDETHSVVWAVRWAVETAQSDPSARPHAPGGRAAFASVIHVDVEELMRIWPLLDEYSESALARYQSLLEVELNGLDLGWGVIGRFRATRTNAVLLGIALAGAWSAGWAHVWGYDILALFRESVVRRLIVVPWVRTVAALVCVLGGAVAIAVWVESRHLAEKQKHFLRFLQRAFALKRHALAAARRGFDAPPAAGAAAGS